MIERISKIRQHWCGYFLTRFQQEKLTALTLLEFEKPKHLRTTPYLLIKKVINYEI